MLLSCAESATFTKPVNKTMIGNAESLIRITPRSLSQRFLAFTNP
jgi:hypothetical protein